jgi:hypothetical protein
MAQVQSYGITSGSSYSPMRLSMVDTASDDFKIGQIGRASLENSPEIAHQTLKDPSTPPSQLNSSGHSSESEDCENQEILHGFFKVEEVALALFKGNKYLAIQLTDPNIDDPKWLHTQNYRECLEICGQFYNLKRIPLSIFQEAIGNDHSIDKPIEIKWEERVLSLTFTEQDGLSKTHLLHQIAKCVLIDEIDEEDEEFLETTFL